jgi:hypothetical protein
MSNIIFAYPNYADVNYYTPVLSGGDWESNLPLSNLQDSLLSKKARSTDVDLDKTRFHADLKVERDIRLMSIHSYNFSRSAKVRFRTSRQIAFSGVQLGANANTSDSSITISLASGSAMIRAGDTLTIAAGSTIYRATSDLALGGNYVVQSEDITSGTWALTRASASTNQIDAPDGTTTVDLLVEDSSNNTHLMTLPGYSIGSSMETITHSIFVKPSGSRNLRIKDERSNGTAYVDFDLSNGVVQASSFTGSHAILASDITELPDGFYRCSMTVTGGSGANIDNVRFYILDASFNDSYQGDGASGLYVWGAQVEVGYLSTYKRSGASAAVTVTSGTITISPTITGAGHSSGDSIACQCGEYVSSAPPIDSGWVDIWPVIYDWYLEWEDPSFWDGRVSEELRSSYLSNYHYLADTNTLARYALVEIDDGLNGDGYVEIGRLFVASGLQPSRNFSYGMNLGWDDLSITDESAGGAQFSDERAKRRMVALQIKNLPKDEALSDFFEMFRVLGRTKQVYVVIDPEEETHKQRFSLLSTIVDPQPLQLPDHNLYTIMMQLKEVIA